MYSLHGSLSNNCRTNRVGFSSVWQTLASEKPKAGCMDWVHVDTVCSFEGSLLGVHMGRLICTCSFKEVVGWDTFEKVDGMCESCKKVRSWLINFWHLSSPWINSLSMWSLCTTSGEFIHCCVTVGCCKSKESSAVFTW